jgi:uncharacterized heparinase superfamily protein
MGNRVRFTNVAAGVLRHVYRRLAVDLGGPMRRMKLRAPRSVAFEVLPARLDVGNSENGLRILDGHFEFSGQNLDVGANGDPWSNASPSEKFAARLHGFDWLDDLSACASDSKLRKKSPDLQNRAAARARYFVDRWISVYGDWNPYAWENDILTNRVFAWLANWQQLLNSDYDSDEAAIRRGNLVRQLKRLRDTYKRTPAGICKFKAAACLGMAGACFTGQQDGFLDRGLDLLDDEIDVQILADGGHISRCPEHTAEALRILITLDSALEARDIQGSKSVRRAIDRLTPMVNFLLGHDGKLFSFNGSGEGRPGQFKPLLTHSSIKAKQFGYAPHTGYQRLERNGTCILVDTGGSPDRPFDLNAHLAPLAFEMSTEAGRLIVNCGWNDDQPSQWREPMRATAAHSTLTLSGQNAGRLIEGGLAEQVLGPAISMPAGPTRSSRKEREAGIWMESTHEGYRFTHGLLHRRRLYLDVLGTDLRGEDSLFVPLGEAPMMREQIPFAVRFHLHPNVRVTLAQDQNSALLIQPNGKGWRFRTDGGPLKVEKTVYLADGNKPRRAEQLVIHGRAYGDGDGQARSNRVRWSLKRMGKVGEPVHMPAAGS